MLPLDPTSRAGESKHSVRRLEEEEVKEKEEEEEASAGKRIKAGEGESEAFSGEKYNIHPFIPLLLLPSSAVPLPPASTSESSVVRRIFT